MLYTHAREIFPWSVIVSQPPFCSLLFFFFFPLLGSKAILFCSRDLWIRCGYQPDLYLYVAGQVLILHLLEFLSWFKRSVGTRHITYVLRSLNANSSLGFFFYLLSRTKDILPERAKRTRSTRVYTPLHRGGKRTVAQRAEYEMQSIQANKPKSQRSRHSTASRSATDVLCLPVSSKRQRPFDIHRQLKSLSSFRVITEFRLGNWELSRGGTFFFSWLWMILWQLYNMEEEFKLLHQDGWGQIFTSRVHSVFIK